MASSTSSSGTFEHLLQTRLAPVVEGAVSRVLLPRIDASVARSWTHLESVDEQLDELVNAVKGVSVTATAILSAQEIARRFEGLREELLARAATHETATATALETLATAVADEIAAHETAMEERVAALEALRLGTLIRLAARRLLGR